jgi:hypothetical protein
MASAKITAAATLKGVARAASVSPSEAPAMAG